MLSIICTTNNDNYEGDCIGRFIKSIDTNCQLLKENNIEYQYINVEWCPVKEYLIHFHRTKHLFQQYNLEEVVLDHGAAEKEGFNSQKFQEYYAKNIGIRQSKYENVLITNCDIVYNDAIIKEIKSLLDENLSDKHFYRARYRYQINSQDDSIIEKIDLHNPNFDDAHVCGCYSGDFLLCKKDILVNVGEGYDEVNPHHKRGYQTNMDGELVCKLHNKGITMQFINNWYGHLYHSKERKYDSGSYNKQGYENKSNWGFIDYPRDILENNKLTIIHK